MASAPRRRPRALFNRSLFLFGLAIAVAGVLVAVTPIGAALRDGSPPALDQPTTTGSADQGPDIPTLDAPSVSQSQSIATGDAGVQQLVGTSSYTVSTTAGWYTPDRTLIGAIVSMTLDTPASVSGGWTFVTSTPSNGAPYATTPETFTANNVTGLDVYVDLGSGAVVGVEPTGPDVSTNQTLSTDSYTNVILADHPAAYWRLGESSTASGAQDSSGNGNAGVYSGVLTLGQASALVGDSNTAVALDGGWMTSPYDCGPIIHCSGSWSLSFGTSDFSLEAWILTHHHDKAIVAEAQGAGNGCLASPGWVMGVDGSGLIKVEVDTGQPGPSGSGCTSASQLVARNTLLRVDDDEWHHVVASISRTSGITIWVDGLAQTTSGTITGVLPANLDFMVGGKINGTSWANYKGQIDEVAAYNYALSTPQALAHFAAGQNWDG
jgi:hypothetical protein